MDERQPPPAELGQDQGPVVRLEATDASTSNNPAARHLPQHCSLVINRRSIVTSASRSGLTARCGDVA